MVNTESVSPPTTTPPEFSSPSTFPKRGICDCTHCNLFLPYQVTEAPHALHAKGPRLTPVAP